MCNLSISISDGVCCLRIQFEFLESFAQWIEQSKYVQDRDYFNTYGENVGEEGMLFWRRIYNCSSWSLHLWPNVRMIAIWPSSEKSELGFRWDLPACCAWGSFSETGSGLFRVWPESWLLRRKIFWFKIRCNLILLQLMAIQPKMFPHERCIQIRAVTRRYCQPS